MLFSEVSHFEYRKREMAFNPTNLNERSMKLRIIERLEKIESDVNNGNSMDSAALSSNIMDSLAQSLEDRYLTEEQLEQVFVKILQTLLERVNAVDSLNLQDRDGLTLLHCAVGLKYYSLATILIKNGVSIHFQDKSGTTPFQWAMKNRDQKMVKIMVDAMDFQRNSNYPPVQNKPIDFTFGMKQNNAWSMGISDIPPHKSNPRSNPPLQKERVSPNRFPAHEHEAAKKIQAAFKIFRERRLKKTEVNFGKKVQRAREAVVAQKRK